jgi:hypothetical protein
MPAHHGSEEVRFDLRLALLQISHWGLDHLAHATIHDEEKTPTFWNVLWSHDTWRH